MPFDLSLIDLVERIKSGELRAEAVMEAVYSRINQYNSSLNVYRSLLPRETAISRARIIDGGNLFRKDPWQTCRYSGID